MLLTISILAAALGVEAVDLDETQTALLTRSATIAESLVSSYIQWKLECLQGENDPPLEYEAYEQCGIRVIRLFPYPVNTVTVTIDGALQPETSYSVDRSKGMVYLPYQRNIRSLLVTYFAGYAEWADVPADLQQVLENVALSIYNRGGTFATDPTTSGLKSLTMFDAMSMSFNETAGSASAAGDLISQWAFVLDKYRADRHVMG